LRNKLDENSASVRCTNGRITVSLTGKVRACSIHYVRNRQVVHVLHPLSRLIGPEE
jgi:hypothetical protein